MVDRAPALPEALGGEPRATGLVVLAVAVRRFARAKPLGFVSGVLLVVLVVVALAAPALATHDPIAHDSQHRLSGLSGDHWLGTDQYGRDVYSRIVHGATISVTVAIIGAVCFAAIAAILGATSAYVGGAYDYIVGRFVDVVQALPGIILFLLLVIIFGSTEYSIGIILGLSLGIVGSRVVRGASIGILAMPYVDAARAIGCSHSRIVMRYVLVNVTPIILVQASLIVGFMIVAEASLSFLGFGVQQPDPSWGGMLSREGRLYMITAPWLFAAPVIALSLVVFSANMFGDAIRDTLDPRLRGSR